MTFTIKIRNWDRFQHRDANRSELTPPWIKDYTRQLSDDDWLDLTYHQRGLLQSLRLEYARAGRNLSGNTAKLSRRLGQRVTTRDLDALRDAGFIDYVTEAGEVVHTTPIQRRQSTGSAPVDDRDGSHGATTPHTIQPNQAESTGNLPAERQHDAGLELNLTEPNQQSAVTTDLYVKHAPPHEAPPRVAGWDAIGSPIADFLEHLERKEASG